MKPHQIIGLSLCCLLAIVMVFLCVDCSLGVTRYWECSVIDHHYIPPRTTIATRTDIDGNTTTETTYHPEEFHVICQESGGSRLFDVNTRRAIYYSHTNGMAVTVKSRMGRWTGKAYLPRFDD